MSEATDNQTDAAKPESGMESGTYEIIRNRLVSAGNELRSRLGKLNEARREVFGSIETELLSTERITTAHNCIARDMVAVGDRFLFGYNIHFGLKSETELSDVFAVYSHADQKLHAEELSLISDPHFEKDFGDLFRYYKNAVFAKFAVRGPNLFMVFRIGRTVGEIKVFKWLIQDSESGTSLQYIDNRSDHEFRFPSQHEFEWTRTRRDDHHYGEHPHVSIKDRVFVETVGGDLTVKVENNTETGEGIYAEPVDHADQTLDDAEIEYALVGNIILMKVRPYQEKEDRYLVFNEKLQQAMRLDSIRDACILLPDDHGLIFPNGYYLQDGEYKTFDHNLSGMLYERTIPAANGEDYLYVFYNRESGTYILLQYNIIEQKVKTPLVCNGWTFFDAGELLCFKAQDDAQKHHAIQIWQTPYVDENVVPATQSDSFLNRVGNKEIVRGMAECHEVLNLINKEDSYNNLYTDLVKQSSEIVDSYFWLSRDDTFNLAETLEMVNAAARAAVEEFEKVVRVRRNTTEQTAAARERTEEILRQIQHRRFEHIDDFVASLADLRSVRGDIISLQELRYVDDTLVEELEASVHEQTERLSRKCVEYLLQESSLQPYEQRVQDEQSRIEGLKKVTDAKALEEEITASATELEMLIEIVSNLRIDDATQRTTIIDNISAIFSTVNQARALLKKKIRELASVEGVAEFNSQMKLLNQSVVNYLDVCDEPAKCEDSLTKVMIQLEELEGRFAEFDEFILQLTEKREEVYNAFENRKLQLTEARNKRANALMNAAERVLKGIQSRVSSFETVNDINGYFASDLMIEKVRDIISQLQGLEDTVKVDDVQSRLKTIREDAIRQLKDRQELYVDGENTIRLGKHLFSVNTQVLDLTTILRNDELCLHLTGTNFFEPITDEELLATRDVWDQEVVSENRSVYRGEFLAWRLLEAAGGADSEIPGAAEIAKLSAEELAPMVQKFMGPRYSEGYTKGVHDTDAGNILQALARMRESIGLLRFDAAARVMGAFYWTVIADPSTTESLGRRIRSVGAIGTVFDSVSGQEGYIQDLQNQLNGFVKSTGLFTDVSRREAAEYLFCELSGEATFAVSQSAGRMTDAFKQYLKGRDYTKTFTASVKALKEDPVNCFILLRNWVQAWLATSDDEAANPDYLDETALVLLTSPPKSNIISATVDESIGNIVGTHPVIDGGEYHLNYNRFCRRLTEFDETAVPKFGAYTERKHTVVEQAREDMRLEEFQPRVLTSFVRNKLLNEVYLPLIGDNLAKQIGAAGDAKRTDLMGLLLLISPPGYGKTTLMEYIANRLGLIFMKINGPALGHSITSLDPSEATNAGAREEVEKLNLALEMGDNVMIYLDDIQHTHPEFLQKFISLCDAQRKIEGVYKGRTRTYDLRGRKVAVVMAGNPYTESGEKFQIPDMLSNRADIYNLGEIIGESANAFEMSYLENSLTSNPVLANLASRSQQDVYAIIRMANDEPRENIELEGKYSLEEINELVATMQKLMKIRDVILQVNREYIRSAAQNDDYRTEPAFKLQGSYRNMNRIAEKVVPVMNDDELTALIVSNYENDAQTLTSGTEANLLKFRELTGLLSDEEQDRWEEIKRTFRQNVKMRGISDDDRTGQVIATLMTLNDGLDSIRKTLRESVSELAESQSESTVQAVATQQALTGMAEASQRIADQTAAAIGAQADAAPATTAPTAAEQPAIPSNVDVSLDLQQVQAALDEINQSITDGMSQLSEAAVAVGSGLNSLPEMAQALAAASAVEPAEELEESEPAAERKVTVRDNDKGPKDPTAITVINKLPPTVVSILKHQFRLMNRWLEPIHRESEAQSEKLSAVETQIKECLKRYEKLIGSVEKRKRKK